MVEAKAEESEAAPILHRHVLLEAPHDAHCVLHTLDTWQAARMIPYPAQQACLRLRHLLEPLQRLPSGLPRGLNRLVQPASQDAPPLPPYTQLDSPTAPSSSCYQYPCMLCCYQRLGFHA